MDLALSPQDEAFRDEVRRFLDENLTEDLREAGRKTGGVFADIDAGMRWHKVLARRGWSAPTWPKEYGGTGWNATERYIFARECIAVDAPRIFAMARCTMRGLSGPPLAPRKSGPSLRVT